MTTKNEGSLDYFATDSTGISTGNRSHFNLGSNTVQFRFFMGRVGGIDVVVSNPPQVFLLKDGRPISTGAFNVYNEFVLNDNGVLNLLTEVLKIESFTISDVGFYHILYIDIITREVTFSFLHRVDTGKYEK